jgi:hypothetical protein
MNSQPFLAVMREIVARHFPEEQDEFDQGADFVIERLERERRPSGAESAFGFGLGDLEHALQFVVLINSTYLAIKNLRKGVGVRQPQVTPQEWERRMIDGGMNPEQARMIATEFAEKLAKLGT